MGAWTIRPFVIIHHRQRDCPVGTSAPPSLDVTERFPLQHFPLSSASLPAHHSGDVGLARLKNHPLGCTSLLSRLFAPLFSTFSAIHPSAFVCRPSVASRGLPPVHVTRAQSRPLTQRYRLVRFLIPTYVLRTFFSYRSSCTSVSRFSPTRIHHASHLFYAPVARADRLADREPAPAIVHDQDRPMDGQGWLR